MNIEIKHTSTKPTIILNLILDESGSMFDQRKQVITGCNEYVQTLRAKNPDTNYVVNLVKFGDETQVVYQGKPIKDVPLVTEADYNPQYWTALRDAIGNTINLTERQMKETYPGATTLFYIFTDGYENKSKEFSAEKIRKMVSSREEKGGWTFSFIGASKDCLEQAKSWGISVGNTITYNADNFVGAMNAMVNSTCCYASNVSNGTYTATRSLFKDAGYDNSKNIDEQVEDVLKNLTK